jgi:hypothetical protein
MRILLCLVLVACGGAVAPEPITTDARRPVEASTEAGPTDVAPGTVDASCGIVANTAGCLWLDTCSGRCVLAPDADCLQCVGGTRWDVCPATPVRQADAESCLYCGGHCDGG